jgi:choline dehydrogenase-like flavoprotein
MLSGIGPRRELEAAEIAVRRELPDVGKNLKDHPFVPMVFPAPGIGLPLAEIGLSMGADALRGPGGPLPADLVDDGKLPGYLADLKAEADRRMDEWRDTGSSYVASSFNDASAFFSTGLGAPYSHDAQVSFMPGGVSADLIRNQLNMDDAKMSDDLDALIAPDSEVASFIVQLQLPRSAGEVVIESADPATPPRIDMNYYGDQTDLKVMVSAMRRGLDIAANWPGPAKLGAWAAPPELARKHGHVPGASPSDALLENMALHFSHTTYHLSCSCRIGSVVDTSLRVMGINNLRVADASVMPEITSGNINAVVIMIGERAAEFIARDHKLTLARS